MKIYNLDKLTDHELELINQYRRNMDSKVAEEPQILCVKVFDMLCDLIGKVEINGDHVK